MSPTTHVQLLVLDRREPAFDMARFCLLSIEETLFGDTALVREWGRIGAAGRRRLDLFERRAQASEALELWLRRKRRRAFRAAHGLKTPSGPTPVLNRAVGARRPKSVR